MTDRQTKNINFFVYSRRATHSPLGTVIEEVCTIFAAPNFFDLISSFATIAYWKFEGKCPHHGKMLITWLFDPKKTKLKTKRYL